MKKYIILLGLTLFFGVVSFATAQTQAQPCSPVTLLCLVEGSVRFQNALVVFAIGSGLTGFLFGVVKYITAGQDEEKMKSGRNLMIFGIIALFVMVTVWGLVQVLQDSFGLSHNPTAPTAPTLPTSSGGSSSNNNTGGLLPGGY